jgi:cytochrome b pre-mRNA-processing protein 3
MNDSLKNFNMSNDNLYNNILLLSRNRLFYTKINLSDTFQNRINLIFIHISFLLIKIKYDKNSDKYKNFSQNIFDLIFRKIDLNMREIGFGDVSVNKNMKFLVKCFYNILFNCEKYNKMDINGKASFLFGFLDEKSPKISPFNSGLVDYFDKYQIFCFDLKADSVLQGNFNFTYK